MPRVLCILVTMFVLTLPPAAQADDFDDALSAYRAGDFAAARGKFLALSKDGDTRAMHNLAHMYRKGQSVKVDLNRAFKYFQYAAKKGFNLSQFQIGRMYRRGQGVKPNAKRALYWMRKAAHSDYARAQLTLGIWYDQGFGGPRDPVKAMKWHIIAGARAKGKVKTDIDARLKKFKDHLSKSRIAEAYRGSKKFQVEQRIAQ